METIYETYIRQICSNCKNRKENLCDIRRDIRGTLRCVYYEKNRQQEGYKQFKGRMANQGKPIMKLNT